MEGNCTVLWMCLRQYFAKHGTCYRHYHSTHSTVLPLTTQHAAPCYHLPLNTQNRVTTYHWTHSTVLPLTTEHSTVVPLTTQHSTVLPLTTQHAVPCYHLPLNMQYRVTTYHSTCSTVLPLTTQHTAPCYHSLSNSCCYRCCIRSFELLMMDGKTIRNM